jgi:hypothetical protein
MPFHGYAVDVEQGCVLGLTGKIMATKLRGKQRYPTVSLSVRRGGKRKIVSAPVHKVVAYALWGRRAFIPSLCVRHLDDNTCNNTRTNLALGTYSQNNMDKAKEVRRSASVKARAAQPSISYNAKLCFADAAEIKRVGRLAMNTHGRVRRGVVRLLAERYNMSRSAISRIIHDGLAYQQEST